MNGMFDRAMHEPDADEQDRRPQSKNHFGFRQKMEQIFGNRSPRILMSPDRKPFHGKRVDHGEEEQDRGQNLNESWVHDREVISDSTNLNSGGTEVGNK